MSTHLTVFVKNPIPGTVKTRLQTRYTPHQAAGIYRAFILDTLETAQSIDADCHLLAYHPQNAENDIRDLAGSIWKLFPQSQTELGDRIYTAALHSFLQGASRVVIIGTDIPSLPSNFIVRAFDLLSKNNLVLGPSTDGGYYLIGLAKPIETIFQDIEWGTNRVFIQTLNRLEKTNNTLALVPPWYDIDTPEDLDFLLAHTKAMDLANSLPNLHHTKTYLSSLT